MPVSMDDVHQVLDPDEVDYEAATRLGAEALPHLMVLVEGGDPALATKAAYLAGCIRDEQSEAVVATAAASGDVRVRVAAASATSMMAPDAASRVLTGLVMDDDVGVQKRALRSVPTQPSADLKDNLRQLSESNPHGSLRQMASDAISGSEDR